MAAEQILIVEDDLFITQDLKGRLEGLGYKVPRTTTSGREALVLARQVSPDLVLMDINLTGEMDGIQTAEQLRALQVPFVYVTGHWGGAVIERAKATEPCGFINKPYQTRDLETSIEIGLHKHRAERARQRPADDNQEAAICHLPPGEPCKFRQGLAGHATGAVAHNQALAGLLSICAYCKKIKEEDDTWSQIEMYIMKRSKATFTHGMCPDCYERVKRQLEELEKQNGQPVSLIIG